MRPLESANGLDTGRAFLFRCLADAIELLPEPRDRFALPETRRLAVEEVSESAGTCFHADVYRYISSISSEYFWFTNLRFTFSDGVSSPFS